MRITKGWKLGREDKVLLRKISVVTHVTMKDVQSFQEYIKKLQANIDYNEDIQADARGDMDREYTYDILDKTKARFREDMMNVPQDWLGRQ